MEDEEAEEAEDDDEEVKETALVLDLLDMRASMVCKHDAKDCSVNKGEPHTPHSIPQKSVTCIYTMELARSGEKYRQLFPSDAYINQRKHE